MIEIVPKALENLENNPGLQGQWVDYGPPEIDGKIIIKNNGVVIAECITEVKKEIRSHHIPHLKALAKEYMPFMLIADRLYPNVKRHLQQANINWMDGAGNIYFRNENHFIWIEHHTTTPVKKEKNRAFTKTGLKVVFLFLHDEEWINKTYREIAVTADVALGNIKYILDGLKQKKFLIKETKKKYKLIRKQELLEQWITAFTDELKPRLHIQNFEFVEEATQQNWKNVALDEYTFWGGEPGADILTNNLKPIEYVLYTHKGKAALMVEYKLKPKPEGNVKVYKPYWNIKTDTGKAAPPLVVYTDLMATGEPRNMNIANDIYERYLAYTT